MRILLQKKLLSPLWPYALATAFILSSITTYAAPNDTQKAWKFGVLGRSTDDTLSSSTVAGLNIGLKFDHSLDETLKMNAKLGAALEAGSSNSLFTDEFAPTNAVYLQNASLLWASSGLQFHVGALEQNHHESPLVIASGTFPATREVFEQSWKTITAHISAQQAVPTSQRLSSKNTGKAATPSLFSEKAALQYNNDDGTKIRARIAHFSFQNLTSGIAQDSRFYGNSVSGISSGSQFIYAYRGWEYGGEVSHPVSDRVVFSVGASFVKNMGAPDSQNQGQFAYFSMEHKRENISWAPRLEYYKNQADASPAFYTDKSYGHNNREGYGASLAVSLVKSKLDIRASYKNSKLIDPQTFQKDKFQYFEISLETPYANL